MKDILEQLEQRRADARLGGGQARIDAQERVEEERRAGLDFRLGKIEEDLVRLEKRLWLAVYGVASGVVVHGALAFLATQF